MPCPCSQRKQSGNAYVQPRSGLTPNSPVAAAVSASHSLLRTAQLTMEAAISDLAAEFAATLQHARALLPRADAVIVQAHVAHAGPVQVLRAYARAQSLPVNSTRIDLSAFQPAAPGTREVPAQPASEDTPPGSPTSSAPVATAGAQADTARHTQVRAPVPGSAAHAAAQAPEPAQASSDARSRLAIQRLREALPVKYSTDREQFGQALAALRAVRAAAAHGVSARQLSEVLQCRLMQANELLSALASAGYIERYQPSKRAACLWRAKPQRRG